MGSTMILMMEGDNYTEAKHCPGFSVACPGKKIIAIPVSFKNCVLLTTIIRA